MGNNQSGNINVILVLCTVPDFATGEMLASGLLENKLAACITVLPGATSFYYWEGKLQKENEIQLIIKSCQQNQSMIIDFIKQHHPYQIPELLVLPILSGDNDYLSWLNLSLK